MTTPAPTRALPLLATGVTLVLWASAFVAIRHLGHTIGPGALSLGRLAVATLALGVMLAVHRRRRGGALRWPQRADWPLVVLCGVAWFGVYNVALNAAERRIDAGTTALVIQVGPLLVALLAVVFLHERLHRWMIAGIVLGFAGVALIAQGSADARHLDTIGVALAVVAALMYAIGVLSQKPLLARVGPLELTFCATAVGTVFCLPWLGELIGLIRAGEAGGMAWVVYLGVFPTAVAFTTWAYALSHTDAGKQAMTTFLVPAITTALAWLLLDEIPPPLAFLGGALAILGVLLTRVRVRPQTRPPVPRPHADAR
ncbi:DMT family transporter [Nocardioides insulae]|uniref:DMT family transporter n=1 Tax=Nocardioides insulae TaxID=394734 RepID=UPI00041E9A8A|nr:DMT family transporter [Nocardioides insulae]